MAQKEKADHWRYRIEPYRPIPGEAGWSPAPEDRAELWFGFREKGDDHRCFGVFASRSGAEQAMAILKERDQRPEKMSGLDRMRAEAEKGRSKEPEKGKERDKERER